MVGVKTTCKDRWRHVLQEAPRIEKKHLLTLQEGISAKQMADIYKHNTTLIVPKKQHSRYPQVKGAVLMGMEDFVGTVRKRLSL
jgi:hypothetical protein